MNAVAWLVPLLLADVAPGSAPQTYTLPQYMAIKRANDPSFSPGADTITFASNASGDWQLWRTPVSHWEPKQLGHFDGGVIGRWSPTGQTIVAMSDRGGDQKYQLFLIDPVSGDTTRITTEPEAGHRLGGWMPDGKSVFYTSNARDRRYFD